MDFKKFPSCATWIKLLSIRFKKTHERYFTILSCWDDNKVYERMSIESAKGGGFGFGRVVGRLPLLNSHYIKNLGDEPENFLIEKEQHEKEQLEKERPMKEQPENVFISKVVRLS